MPKTFRNHSFKTKIDMPRRGRTELVTLLNARLADTFDLYSQIKQAHWNVKGKNFFPLHELFDKLAADVLPFVDEIAERAASKNQNAPHGLISAACTFPAWPCPCRS